MLWQLFSWFTSIPSQGRQGPPCQGPCPHSLLSEESRFLSLVHVRQNLPATSMDFKHWLDFGLLLHCKKKKTKTQA
ncbi:hypothetical protein CapIbe_022663 [Capra ibex]